MDLQQPVEGVYWQAPEQMHLTLKFVGNVDHQKAKHWTQKLAEVEHPNFTITGIGYFPGGDQPNVIWTGIKENRSLVGLHQKVERACNGVRITPENRPYRPHITLGRAKNVSKRTVNSFINEHKKFAMPDVQINEFVLHQSKSHSDGARHSRLQTFPLKK